jgi:Ca-activated chloride channel family protein
MKNLIPFFPSIVLRCVFLILILISSISTANNLSNEELCIKTYPRWIILSSDLNIKVGDTISNQLGLSAIVTSYNIESKRLNYFHPSPSINSSFNTGDSIYISNVNTGILIHHISGIKYVVDNCKIKIAEINREKTNYKSYETALYEIPASISYSQALVIPNYSHSTSYTLNDEYRENYSRISSNSFKNVTDDPLSTFSIDVDTASYGHVRRYLQHWAQPKLPPVDSIRIEEMINYFDYDYPQPTNEHPISVISEISSAPWSNNQLIHIGMQGKDIDISNFAPSNLVFLIDTSGSMSDEIWLVKRSLEMLVDNLREDDTITIVAYAGSAGLVLPATKGNNKKTIIDAINDLESGGSTAGGEGIELAYKMAKQNFIHGGNNRVIIATDGDFNVGITSQANLTRLIEKKRNDLIFLSILGFGEGNYQDSKMEQLADKGNGNYSYIDSLLEAKKVLVNEIGGTIYTIAKDVKIQVEFNPAKVKSYRLVGYENRLLNKEDFNNDTKDAGELGSGHTVTALYEITLIDSQDPKRNVDALKYQAVITNEEAIDSNEILTVKVRYKEPKAENSQLISIPVSEIHTDFENSSNDFRFSSAVAAFGMLLRDSDYKGDISFKKIQEIANQAKGKDLYGYRSEFVKLVELAEILSQ